MLIRAYLRASTEDQDATRARQALERFVFERDLVIASRYVENASGTTLDRPALARLLDDCLPGDVILVEQIDRLSRLDAEGWTDLKRQISAKNVSIVSLDLPTSWSFMNPSKDPLTARVHAAVNDMMLDLLAAFARKDYDDRRRRQMEGIAKAKEEKRYQGRPRNLDREARIIMLNDKELKHEEIAKLVGCSRRTVLYVLNRNKVLEDA